MVSGLLVASGPTGRYSTLVVCRDDLELTICLSTKPFVTLVKTLDSFPDQSKTNLQSKPEPLSCGGRWGKIFVLFFDQQYYCPRSALVFRKPRGSENRTIT